MLRRAGVAAYLITADELGGELVALADGGARDVEGGAFRALFDEREWADAVTELSAVLGQSGRVLSDAAACVLCDAIGRAGAALGRLEVPAGCEGQFAAWAERCFPRVVGLPDAHVRALSGGFVELRAAGRFELGALPLDVLRGTDWAAREWSPGERAVMGETSPYDDRWAEGLLEVLRAAQRLAPALTDTAAVVFAPWWVRAGKTDAAHADDDADDADANDEAHDSADDADADAGDREDEDPAGPAHDDAGAARPAPSILDLLQRAVAAGASDLLLTFGRPPLLRVDGRLRALDERPLDEDALRRAVYVVLTEGQKARLDRDEALRLSFGVRGLGRFRAALFFQRGSLAASLRVHPAAPPALEDLGVPNDAIARLDAARAGLVLVAGPAGAGRTTTAASLVARHAARGRSVLTIEAPIELVLSHGEGVVNQVEPQGNARPGGGLTLADAAALARDLEAEVVLVDHVDDPVRAALALDLAAQGRLVVSTAAALDASDARARLALRLGDGPGAREQVARHVALVVSQRLTDTGREGLRTLEVRLG